MPALTPAQLAAANPNQSVWVSANAGTGKTFVLAIRLLRLLLNDDSLEPHQILAVTFTNAAASEMLNRFLKLCRELATLTDTEIHEKLTFYGLETITDAHTARAKSLFALCQASPPNITTLNGFCQSLLQQFPLESGLSPNFDLLDEPAAKQLQHATMQHCLRAWGSSDHPLHGHFTHLCAYTSDYSWLDTLKLCITQRARLGRLLRAQPTDVLLAELRDAHALTEADTWEHIQATRDAHVTPALYQALREKLADLPYEPKTTRKLFEQKLDECLAFPPSYERYVDVYTDAKGNLSEKPPLTGKKKPHQDFFLAEKLALKSLEDRAKGALVVAHTAAFLHLGQAFAEAYQTAKAEQNSLDFDDQILFAHRLLTASEARAWVAYKLDGGYKHALLDEGQDIDHNQRQLVQVLADNLFDANDAAHAHEGEEIQADFFFDEACEGSPQGAGSVGSVLSTLFAVGDMKQSIYRFRGAQPPAFMGLGEWLVHEKNGEKVLMQQSFRSASAILQATDQIFAAHQNSLTGSDDLTVAHTAFRESLYGQVTLWAPEPVVEKTIREPWTPPQFTVQPTGMHLLGQRIVRQILAMVGTTVLGEGTEARLANYGDCMILVRSWGSAAPLMAALSAVSIPFTLGKPEDPLKTPLGEDMMALLNWVVNPHNNLALACFLKGFLVSWTDEQLQQLIAENHTSDKPFWTCLAQHDAPLSEKLEALLICQTPTELLHHLRAHWHGNALAQQRFGMGAGDAFDGFVTLAESFTSNCAAWLLQLETVGISELPTVASVCDEDGHNAVRILSVHGAKGLEAPIVFLPDTHPPRGKHDPLLWEQDEAGDDHAVLLPLGTKTDVVEDLEAAEKVRTEADALRLLYVALTRAEQYVFVGCRSEKDVQPNKDGSEKNCWYNWVLNAASEENGWHQTDAGDWVLAQNQPTQKTADMAQGTTDRPSEQMSPPAWLTAPFPASSVKLKTQQSEAQKRGERIHEAIACIAQGLPFSESILPDEQAEAEAVCTAFPSFLDNARFELPLSWQTPEGKTKHGRLDALLETDDGLLVIDFKTDVQPSDEDVAAYQAQVAGYVRALEVIYPAQKINGAILWTRAPKLDYIET